MEKNVCSRQRSTVCIRGALRSGRLIMGIRDYAESRLNSFLCWDLQSRRHLELRILIHRWKERRACAPSIR